MAVEWNSSHRRKCDEPQRVTGECTTMKIKSNFTGKKILLNGTKEWYLDDKLHREDGPAVEWTDGLKRWHLNGKLHREDGPAIECSDGYRSWWISGKLHREDGPAREWANGTKEWWLNGIEVTEEEVMGRLSN